MTERHGHDRSEARAKLLDSISGNEDGEVLLFSDERAVIPVEPVPTGALTLDFALGVGGFPKGKMIELSGNPGSGKTTLALSCVAGHMQRDPEALVGFIDAENALTKELVAGFEGLDPDRLLYYQPQSGEDAAQAAVDWAMTGGVDIIVVDSVAAMLPSEVDEADFGQHKIAPLAKLMTRFTTIIKPKIGIHQTTLILINQLRSSTSAYGSPEYTPGGRALEFYCDVRVKCRTSAGRRIKDKKGLVIGTSVDATVEKNKFAGCPRQAAYDIIFGRGIVKERTVLRAAVDLGIVEKSGSFVKYEGETIGQGMEKAEAFIKETEGMTEELEGKIADEITRRRSC